MIYLSYINYYTILWKIRTYVRTVKFYFHGLKLDNYKKVRIKNHIPSPKKDALQHPFYIYSIKHVYNDAEHPSEYTEHNKNDHPHNI